MEKVFDLLLKNNLPFYRIRVLIVANLATLLLILSTFPAFEDNLPNKGAIKFTTILVAFVIITSIWLYKRLIFPKGAINKENIVIAITTENDKQKTRITKDFAEQLKTQLLKYQLDNSYGVIVTNNHLSEKINQTNLSFIKRKTSDQKIEDKEKFDRMSKRMNAKFYVFGNLICRNAPNNLYVFNIEASIRHGKTNNVIAKVLQNDFQQIWEREIQFLEEKEYTGFQSTSDQIFFSATYMIGLATFTSHNYEKGIEIFLKLLDYIKQNEKYQHFSKNVSGLLTAAYWLLSRKYHIAGEHDKADVYRRLHLKMAPDEYAESLNESMFQIAAKNPSMALQYIEKAKNLAGSNGTWRYNKFYVLIRLGKDDLALTILDEILTNTYLGENDTIEQVIAYNIDSLTKDPGHIQSLFIVGVILFKKMENPADAYENINSFIKASDSEERWAILRQRALIYFRELKEILELE